MTEEEQEQLKQKIIEWSRRNPGRDPLLGPIADAMKGIPFEESGPK